MPRFTPYFGTVAALFVWVFLIAISDNVSAPDPDTSAQSSPITLDTSQPVTTITPEETAEVPETTRESEPKPEPKIRNVVADVSSSTPISAPAAPAVKLPIFETNTAFDASSSALRAALVNIICYAAADSSLRSISGSGVFIDSKGIIITNAHVAQYFLLADRGVSCTIRSGSPAISKYKAALVYISPSWIRANMDVLNKIKPIGTGEYDFAFLAVTKSVTKDELPTAFSFVPLATSPPPVDAPVVIATYGAQFLEQSQIQSFLFPTIVFGSVKSIFTFASTTVDVLALGGSVAAQEGSSGGGVADKSGALVGTITTSTIDGATDTRSLSAITSSYIRAAYAGETGLALDMLLAKPTATAISDFAQQIPALEAIITANL